METCWDFFSTRTSGSVAWEDDKMVGKQLDFLNGVIQMLGHDFFSKWEIEGRDQIWPAHLSEEDGVSREEDVVVEQIADTVHSVSRGVQKNYLQIV